MLIAWLTSPRGDVAEEHNRRATDWLADRLPSWLAEELRRSLEKASKQKISSCTSRRDSHSHSLLQYAQESAGRDQVACCMLSRVKHEDNMEKALH